MIVFSFITICVRVRTSSSVDAKTGFVMKLWMSALTGAAAAWLIKLALPALHPIVSGVLILGPYGVVYFAVTFALRVPEGLTVMRRIPGVGSRNF